MGASVKSWERYEEAARKVLSNLRAELGISSVEGKQQVSGASGTSWEIDAKAWVDGSHGFLVVEVRRHTKAGLSQEQVAAIAYRISDVAAEGGVTVSPLPLQKGAATVASHANMRHLRLDPASTTESYLAQFMGKTFHGASVSESARVTDHQDATVIRGDKRDT